MKRLNKTLAVIMLSSFLWAIPLCLHATTPPPDPCQALAAQLADQNKALSNELRRIQRELAALRTDMDKPGLKEIMAGIGYIFGFFGIAAFVASRKKG